MLSSAQKSQVYKRNTYLTESVAQPQSARPKTSFGSNLDKKELRRYPTEWVEQIDNKSDNRFYHTILNQSKAEHNPSLASPSKIFAMQEGLRVQTEDGLSAFRRKNQSLGNLGSWQYNSTSQPTSNTIAQPQASTARHTLSRRIDASVPLKDLLEISKYLDCSTPEEIKSLSKGYVNELLQLSQTITRTLKNVRR